MSSFESGSSPTHESWSPVDMETGYLEGSEAARLFDGLALAANEMLSSPDSLTRAIGEKLAMKVRVKSQVDDLLDGADNIERHQDLKKLGVFVIREEHARFTYEDPESGFSIKEGESFLDIHLPPVPIDRRNRDSVQSSLEMLAKYMKFHGINPKYILGITYERLGRFAERAFDFNRLDINPGVLPNDVVNGVVKVYEATGRAEEMGPPVVIYRDVQGFLDQYSPQTDQETAHFALDALRHILGRGQATIPSNLQ